MPVPDLRQLMGAADLSPAAIAARRKAAGAKGAGSGGLTGRQLIDSADVLFGHAKRLARAAIDRPPGKRRAKASAKADEALRNAAAQIRIAEQVPLDKGYLHHLQLSRVQAVKDDVARAFDQDHGATLAVDTHRRIVGQRQRIRDGRREP